MCVEGEGIWKNLMECGRGARDGKLEERGHGVMGGGWLNGVRHGQ